MGCRIAWWMLFVSVGCFVAKSSLGQMFALCTGCMLVDAALSVSVQLSYYAVWR